MSCLRFSPKDQANVIANALLDDRLAQFVYECWSQKERAVSGIGDREELDKMWADIVSRCVASKEQYLEDIHVFALSQGLRRSRERSFRGRLH